MARVHSPHQGDSALRTALRRVWASLRPPPVPDYPVPQLDRETLWLRRLARARDLLEQARTVIVRDGWTSGGWFAVARAGGVRPVTAAEAFDLLAPGSAVVNGCLVGTLLRIAEDPDTVPSVADVGTCVTELYEAMHEQLGHDSLPPGRVPSLTERRTAVQGLTGWNDAPGRTQADLLDLIDRAISRTIVASCAR